MCHIYVIFKISKKKKKFNKCIRWDMFTVCFGFSLPCISSFTGNFINLPILNLCIAFGKNYQYEFWSWLVCVILLICLLLMFLCQSICRINCYKDTSTLETYARFNSLMVKYWFIILLPFIYRMYFQCPKFQVKF